ncbi:MAG: TerB family tellurite resistance protein [Polaromonas sp.]
MVENLWQIAYADAHLDAHENSLIGKFAELLHVTQGEYIGAKMQAKEAANLACTVTAAAVDLRPA